MTHPIVDHALHHLLVDTGARSRRASTWDRTGANADFVQLEPGAIATVMDHEGPGCIGRIYMTMLPQVTDWRDLILRFWWDGEETPSVEVPVGDFFGIAWGRVRLVQSAMLAVQPGNGVSFGLTAHFPMPFSKRAVATIEHRGDRALSLWFHADYETYERPPPSNVVRFHAQYRQTRPTERVATDDVGKATNLTGAGNYCALDAVGSGQMVGLHLQVDNPDVDWYGEGDDMVFIDGDEWPPSIHGTGTEEIFGGGACPNVEYTGPYAGFHLVESRDFQGCNAMYRWYITDPIRFTQSVRWTIEHGHANAQGCDYASVAYWYQTEPHGSFPLLPSAEAMRPRLGPQYDEANAEMLSLFDEFARLGRDDPAANRRLIEDFYRTDSYRPFVDAFYRGEWTKARDGFRAARTLLR